MCNWHIAVNAFTESYHTLYLHRSTTPAIMGGHENLMRHLPAVELAKRHLRFANPGNPEYKPTPAEGIAYQYGPPMYPSFRSSPEAMPPGVNFAKVKHWAFDVVHLFPNAIIVTGNGFAFELWAWPDGPDRCILESVILGTQPSNVGHRIAQEFNIMRSREVLAEDLASLEIQQKAIASGAIRELRLSLQEIGIAHHYRTMRDMLGAA
jgi:Rieske 2Fe-2S family protein